MTGASATPPAGSAPTRAQAARDVTVQLVGRVGNLALGVVVTILIVRTLGVDRNGEWVTLLAATTLVGTLTELGLETVAVRRAAAEPEEAASWIGALLVLKVALAIPAALVVVLITSLIATSPEMRLAGALLSATLLVSSLASLRVVFQLAMRNDRTIVVMTFNSVIWMVAVAGVTIAGGGLVAFAAAFAITQVASNLLQAAWVLRTTKLAFHGVRARAREMLRIGVVLGIGATLTLAYGRIDQLLVLHYTGERGAGLYGTSYTLLERVQFLPATIMTTAFPLLAAAWPADPARMRRLVQQVLEAMALISVPALAFTLVASKQALVLLFGQEFAESARVLPVLMLAFVFTCFGYLLGFMAVIVDRQRTFAFIALGALAFNIAANVVFLPRYGYLAAAWVTVATEVLVIGFAARTALSPLGMQLRPGRLPNAAAAGALMSLCVLVAQRAGVGAVGLGAVAAVTYPVGVIAFGGLSAGDRRFLTARLRRRD